MVHYPGRTQQAKGSLPHAQPSVVSPGSGVPSGFHPWPCSEENPPGPPWVFLAGSSLEHVSFGRSLSLTLPPSPKSPLSVQSIFFYSIKQTKARAALSPESAALGFTRLGFASHLHAGVSGDPPMYSTSQMGKRGLEGEGHSAKRGMWRLDLGPSDSALGEPSPSWWPISTSL